MFRGKYQDRRGRGTWALWGFLVYYLGRGQKDKRSSVLVRVGGIALLILRVGGLVCERPVWCWPSRRILRSPDSQKPSSDTLTRQFRQGRHGLVKVYPFTNLAPTPVSSHRGSM